MNLMSRTDRFLPLADLALERPLYFGLQSHVKISLESPEALTVQPLGQPRRRIPLARLSRVVLGPRAECDADVLRALLKKGISVSFLDGEGHAFAHAWGERVRQFGVAALLEFAEDDPAWWTEHYRNWKLGIERAQVTRSLLGLGFDIREYSSRSARSALASHYLRRHGESPAPLFTAIDRLLPTYASGCLARRGWFAEDDLPRRNLLVGDLVTLLAPALYRALADHPSLGGRTAECARDVQWCALFIEHDATTRHDAEVILHLLENLLRKLYD